MKIAATILAAALAAGCAPAPDRAPLSADFRAPQGLKVGVRLLRPLEE
jgi:hypothetical protein